MPDAQPTRSHRAFRALAAAVLAFAGAAWVAPAPAAAQANDQVGLVVTDMAPLAPSISDTPRPLTISLEVTNLTDTELTGITIAGQRAAPVASAAELGEAIKKPAAPGSAHAIPTKAPVMVDLAAGQTSEVIFQTSTSTQDGASVICICTPGGVYPLFFTASLEGKTLGTTQTYLPAFFAKPAVAQVAWLWPLIDRPHRLLTDDLFTDDDLAASVSGGRLDRALHTVELVTATNPDIALTLVVDPELLDELAVIATGYRVVGARKPTTGTGGPAAAQWLDRLRRLLDDAPKLTLAFTPFADPELTSLAGTKLGWSVALPPAMQARLAIVLGARLPAAASIAWPAAGALTRRAAARLADDGPHTVVLDATSVPDEVRPADGTAFTVRARGQELKILTTAPDVAAAVVDAVSADGAGMAALPRLQAQVAIRVAADVNIEHQLVLAPPRATDPDPKIAARAITETTSAFWSAPIGLTAATSGTGGPVAPRALTNRTDRAARLSRTLLTQLRHVSERLPVLRSLLDNPQTPHSDESTEVPLMTQLPVALQRASSTAWTDDRRTGRDYAAAVREAVADVEASVSIVKPQAGKNIGSYTLASNNSPLPLTIRNTLPYPVYVKPQVRAVNRVPGFSAREPDPQEIGANGKTPVKVPASTKPVGVIRVEAKLLTPSGDAIGQPVQLDVHSSALGTIGLIITIVAGVVLALALLRRFVLRYRRAAAPEPAEPSV